MKFNYQCSMLYAMLLELIGLAWIAYWSHHFDVVLTVLVALCGLCLIHSVSSVIRVIKLRREQ